jgi:hypothetical protein
MGRQVERGVNQVPALDLSGSEGRDGTQIRQPLPERHHATARLLNAGRPVEVDGRCRAQAQAKSRPSAGRPPRI